MAIVGLMDGMQIALFAVVNIPDDDLKRQNLRAYQSCQLAFEGTNLQAFLIGRQICVTMGMFVVARVTTLYITIGTDDNLFGVSNGIQVFFNTGLLGAMITTIVASLIWRVVASSFPVAYLANPIVYAVIRLCLWVEQSGICSSAWTLAHVHKRLVGYQPDEVHLSRNMTHTTKPHSSKQQQPTTTTTTTTSSDKPSPKTPPPDVEESQLDTVMSSSDTDTVLMSPSSYVDSPMESQHN